MESGGTHGKDRSWEWIRTRAQPCACPLQFLHWWSQRTEALQTRKSRQSWWSWHLNHQPLPSVIGPLLRLCVCVCVMKFSDQNRIYGLWSIQIEEREEEGEVMNEREWRQEAITLSGPTVKNFKSSAQRPFLSLTAICHVRTPGMSRRRRFSSIFTSHTLLAVQVKEKYLIIFPVKSPTFGISAHAYEEKNSLWFPSSSSKEIFAGNAILNTIEVSKRPRATHGWMSPSTWNSAQTARVDGPHNTLVSVPLDLHDIKAYQKNCLSNYYL